MARGEVILKADKIKGRKIKYRQIKIVLIVLMLLLMGLFMVLSFAYNGGNFTVTLDPNFYQESGIIIYDDLENAKYTRKLYAKELEFMDNISINWLPDNIDKEKDGSHNGDNYIAYSFYVENKGTEIIDYWYQMYIDDVIKNVDEAVRIMIYQNGEKKVYAKVNPLTKTPEEGTIPFENKEYIILENRSRFAPGDRDRYTVVIWLEGDDPECVDNIIGGEIKMHMEIVEEHIEINNKTINKLS